MRRSNGELQSAQRYRDCTNFPGGRLSSQPYGQDFTFLVIMRCEPRDLITHPVDLKHDRQVSRSLGPHLLPFIYSMSAKAVWTANATEMAAALFWSHY
jgi:hypothetical protein